MDKAQAICLDACIPQSWWEFAVLHAIHLYNQTPVKRLGYKTPFEKLRGVKPSISHLRVFGCGAYVFLPEEVRVNKLAPKSELMTFIGFADGVKGYLFMRSPNNVVFTAVKALFDEKMFPKCPEMERRGYTPIGDEPDIDDSNIPPEDDGHNNSDADDDFFSPAPEKWHATLPPPPPPGEAPNAREDSDDDDEWLEKAKEKDILSQQNTPQWRNIDLPSTPRPPRTRELPGSLPLRQSLLRDVQEMPPSPEPNQPAHSTDQQEGPSGLQPCQSGRTRQPPPAHEGDIYGQWNPVDCQRQGARDWNRMMNPVPSRPDSDRSAEAPSNPSDKDVARMAQEGGVDLIHFLLVKAVSPTDATEILPSPNSVREWQFRDILKFPKGIQEEWKAACCEELEALHR